MQFKYTASIIKVGGLRVAIGLEKCEKGMHFSEFFIFLLVVSGCFTSL